MAEHADPTSTTQSFRKRSPLTISTVACKAEVVLATGATRGNQCDILTIGGDPGDEVSGLITAYPVVDGVRQCSQPAGAAEWSAAVGDSGSVTVTSPGVDLSAGNYEWIEEAWTADGRTGGSRDCLTSPRVAAESFKMSPSKGTPGKGIPATGVNSWLMMECSLGVLGIGVAMARAGHRTRAVMRR